MKRFAIATASLAFLGSLACVKAPALKSTSPEHFRGFATAPVGEGRVLLFRGGRMVGAGYNPTLVEMGDCKFEIGVRQFAVCRAPAGTSDIVSVVGLDAVEVAEGEWACVELTVGMTEVSWAETKCTALVDRLEGMEQVWTTQISRDQIRDRPPY